MTKKIVIVLNEAAQVNSVWTDIEDYFDVEFIYDNAHFEEEDTEVVLDDADKLDGLIPVFMEDGV